MCHRATARQGGTMARAAAAAASAGSAAAIVHSFGKEEEYIDLDLSSCGELEFRVRRRSSAEDEQLLCRGRVAKSGARTHEADAGGGGGCGGGRRSAATVAPLQHSHSAVGGFRDAQQPAAEGTRRRKAARTTVLQAKLQRASRALFRSLFARTSCADERRCHGPSSVRARKTRATPYGDTTNNKSSCYSPLREVKNGCTSTSTTLRSSIEREKLMDEAARQRRSSFSGVIRWRHAATTSPAKLPLSYSSSARRSPCTGGGGGVGPAMKRSNSARSESEGLIQGAIAYCKRSQQQLGLAGRKSVGDAALLCPGPPSCSWPS